MSFSHWRAYAPLGVGLGVVVLLTMAALTNHQRYAEAAYQTARQEYEQSKRIVTADATAQRPYTGDKSYREEWRAERDLEAQRLMAWWSRIGGLATCIGILLLATTLWETTRTTIAAAEAAQATKDSVEVARSTAERQLRAYVFPISASMLDFAIGSIPRADITIKNTGQTPAYDCTVIACIYRIGLPIVGAFPAPEVPTRMSGGSLGPGMERHPKPALNKPLCEADHTEIMDGRDSIFVFGRINYTDAFGEPRFANFRYEFGRQNARRNDGGMHVCAEGNESN